jgi:hypothetical protein
MTNDEQADHYNVAEWHGKMLIETARRSASCRRSTSTLKTTSPSSHRQGTLHQPPPDFCAAGRDHCRSR